MSAEGVTFRCDGWARWLPRTLAAAVLALTVSLLLRLSQGGLPSWLGWGPLAIGLVGLWLVFQLLRRASEVRMTYVLTERGVRFAVASTERRLDYDDVDSLDYDFPLAAGRGWLPALSLTDGDGRTWRVCALIGDAPRFLREFLARADSDRLRSWAAAKRVEPRLAASRLTLPAGYGLALGLFGLALWVEFLA